MDTIATQSTLGNNQFVRTFLFIIIAGAIIGVIAYSQDLPPQCIAIALVVFIFAALLGHIAYVRNTMPVPMILALIIAIIGVIIVANLSMGWLSIVGVLIATFIGFAGPHLIP